MLSITIQTMTTKLATSRVAADCAGSQQDQDQRVAEAGEELQPERAAPDGRGVIRPESRQP